MRSWLRVLCRGLGERRELVEAAVYAEREITRLVQENAAAKAALRHMTVSRDEAWSLVADLRMDCATLQEGFDNLLALGHDVADNKDGWKRRAQALYVIADPRLRDEAMEAIAGIEEVPQVDNESEAGA